MSGAAAEPQKRFLRRRFRLIEKTSISPSVGLFSFRAEDNEPLHYRAGQWVKVHCSEEIARDYSIASAPAKNSAVFQLAITRVAEGFGSNYIHALPEGALVPVSGPDGFFTRDDKHKSTPALYIATGSGVAPIRAILQEELAGNSNTQQEFLFGCRDSSERLFFSEWQRLAQEHSRFRFETTCSREKTERQGYVQTHLREMLERFSETPHIYICGLSKMVTDVREILKKELKIGREFVHSERFD